MIAYASYLPKKSNITRNAIMTGFINCGYSIFAGLAVFSVLGFMATTEQKPIADVVSQSIGLAFVAYPKAVSIMPGGSLFGAIFFLCLFVAGLSSSISIIEAFTSAIIDKFGLSRKSVVTPVCIIGFAGSIIFATQAGIHWLDILDHFLTHYGLVVIGLFECILVGWLFRLERLRTHINKISSIKLGPWWNLLIRYFVPFVLGIILIGDIWGEIKKPYGGYSWSSLIVIGRDWLLLTLGVGFFISTRAWKTKNNKNPGRSDT
jgi:NSS family neurotransmitter:Na+ symporter